MMIAGGVGVTPFKSMSAAAAAFGKKSWLFYSTKKKEDLVFIDFFEKLSFKNKDKFFFEYTLTQPPERWQGRTGRFTLDEIKQAIGGSFENKIFFICGPKAMADGFSQQLLEAKVAKECIKAEGWG
ncbi:FAD-dependent oxidoreductase [Candidatus Micrarchaeota archaeon]|nr:FAD-dependent oxidoreductase [Candidatus Micrarchaeota archaeon]